MNKKNGWSDFFFFLQLLLGFYFCIGQFVHMLNGPVSGVVTSMFVGVELFVVINLVIMIRSYRVHPDRPTGQAVIVYAMWVIGWGTNVALFILKGGVSLGAIDGVSVAGIAVGGIFLALYARRNRLSIADGIVRGWVALLFKAVPQLGQAASLAFIGSAPGIGMVMIVVGHLTILTRFAQLVFANHRAVGERNRRGSLLSEIGNECSWIIVTILWLILR